MSDEISDEVLTAESLKLEWEKLQKEKLLFIEERENSGIEYKLFCGNLDDSTNEEDLKGIFSPFGAIKDVMILREADGASKRSGFVKFYYKKDGNAAIDALNGKYRDKDQDKMLAVSIAISKNNSTLSHGMPAVHKPSHGPPSGMPGYPGAPHGAMGGYQHYGGGMHMPMHMHHMPQQTAAYYAPGMMYQGGVMPGGGYPMPAPTANSNTKGPPGANLYVNNLRAGINDVQLRQAFAAFGTILSAHVMSQGNFGFVSFDNALSADAAIRALHGNSNFPFAAEGKTVEVSLKKERKF